MDKGIKMSIRDEIDLKQAAKDLVYLHENAEWPDNGKIPEWAHTIIEYYKYDHFSISFVQSVVSNLIMEDFAKG